jgi:hypothetical protein
MSYAIKWPMIVGISVPYRVSISAVRRLLAHRDPLVEASNWVAFIIGSHLPFWPLYVLWAAGPQALPTALLTVALAPIFVAIPLLSRRNGLLGRIAMLLAGVANTVFTIWILGEESGTAFFLIPCAALASILFRRTERWLMLCFTLLPLAVWCVLQDHAPVPLHRYDKQAAQEMFTLNIFSVAVLIATFGWLQADIYRRMERPEAG